MKIKKWKTIEQFQEELAAVLTKRNGRLLDDDEMKRVIERSENEPISAVIQVDDRGKITGHVYWFFKGYVYNLREFRDRNFYTNDQVGLLILENYDNERRRFEKLKQSYKSESAKDIVNSRERIPEEVRIAVWRRDEGKCAKCGSREKLEYDHIVPVSKGGSNTARNIELLCETCNRKKSNNIE